MRQTAARSAAPKHHRRIHQTIVYPSEIPTYLSKIMLTEPAPSSKNRKNKEKKQAAVDLGSASRVRKKPSSGGWWTRGSMTALDGSAEAGAWSPHPPVACAQEADAEAGRASCRGRRDITAAGEGARAPHAVGPVSPLFG